MKKSELKQMIKQELLGEAFKGSKPFADNVKNAYLTMNQVINYLMYANTFSDTNRNKAEFKNTVIRQAEKLKDLIGQYR